MVLGGSLERQMCRLTGVLSSACNRDGWEETILPQAVEAYNRGKRGTTLAPIPLPSAEYQYPISLWYSKPSGRPARIPTRTRCRICFGQHLTTSCEGKVCEPTEAQRQSLMRYRAVLGIPWWKAMIALLIQDCEAALREEEFITACSTEGSTLPMIHFEVRELPDEETPTPAYLNWTAQRISEIQRNAESQRRRKIEPVSVVLPEFKHSDPPGAQGLLRCVTNEHCVSKSPARAEDGKERRMSGNGARLARPTRVRRPSPHPMAAARRRRSRRRRRSERGLDLRHRLQRDWGSAHSQSPDRGEIIAPRQSVPEELSEGDQRSRSWSPSPR